MVNEFENFKKSCRGAPKHQTVPGYGRQFAALSNLGASGPEPVSARGHPTVGISPSLASAATEGRQRRMVSAHIDCFIFVRKAQGRRKSGAGVPCSVSEEEVNVSQKCCAKRDHLNLAHKLRAGWAGSPKIVVPSSRPILHVHANMRRKRMSLFSSVPL